MQIQSNYSRFNNNYNISKNPQANNCNQSNNVSFGGKGRFALKACGVLGVLVGGCHWTAINLSNYFQTLGGFSELYSNSNQSEISKNIGWDSNVRVLASEGQNVSGIGYDKDNYAMHLADKVSDRGISTLEQANIKMGKEGYKISEYPYKFNGFKYMLSDMLQVRYINKFKTLFPLETYGPQLNIFNKADKNKTRFVLSLYDSLDKRFAPTTKAFNDKIVAEYHIPKQNIIQMPIASMKGIGHGVDSIMGQINQLKNKDNVELLIFCNGHGGVDTLHAGDEKVEGNLEGLFTTPNITETKVKALLHEKLNGIKTLFMMDACDAGAWIAQNTKQAVNRIA